MPILDSCHDWRLSSGLVGSGRRPSPEATQSAIDGFRSTPDNREAGMSHLGLSGGSIELARPCAQGLKRERCGQRRCGGAAA